MKKILWKTDLEEFKVVYCEFEKNEFEVDEDLNRVGKALSVLKKKTQYRVYSREIGDKNWELFAELDTKEEVVGLLTEINAKESK